MKNIYKLLILAILLVVLVLVYVAVSHILKKDGDDTDDTGDPINTTYTAAEIDIDTMYSLKYTNGDKEYEFSLNDDHTLWLWSENRSLPLDNSYFASMASALENVTTTLKLTVTGDELKNYGLDEPWLRVSVSDSKNGNQTFLFGDLNSFNNKYYFMSSANTSSVYLVSPSIPTYFIFTPYDMVKNDTLPTVEGGTVKGVKVSTPLVTNEYIWSDDTWNVLNGDEKIAVTEELSNAIESLYPSLAFSSPAAYTTGERQGLGLDGGNTLTIYYTENKTVTDQNTGITTTIPVDSSLELLIGYATESGIYAGLRDSVLSYIVDPTYLSLLYSSNSAE